LKEVEEVMMFEIVSEPYFRSSVHSNSYTGSDIPCVLLVRCNH